MSNRDDILNQYMLFATDINRNLSNIIHLTNNLRYNTFQMLNNHTNSSQLTNDIFFPPIMPPPPPPINAPPSRRRNIRRRRPLRPRLVPQESGLPAPSRLGIFFHQSPTETQIVRATESALYTDISTNYLMCPIDQQNFESEDRILRIRQCRHVFRESAIRQWFRTSFECPVCRHDIRNVITSRDVVTQTSLTDSSRNSLVVDISNNSSRFEYSLSSGRFFD